jgi:hypothetical protein
MKIITKPYNGGFFAIVPSIFETFPILHRKTKEKAEKDALAYCTKMGWNK